MPNKPTVSHEEWLEARQALLRKEKEFTKLRDELSELQRKLPWEKVEQEYFFTTDEGKRSLSDLFSDSSQLIVYHFMFAANWTQGCPACSLIADHYNAFHIHLSQRDISLATVSQAPLDKINAFKQRMGWDFTWVSSHENSFNRDYRVAFTPEELEQGEGYYNYTQGPIFPSSEAPGLSVFYKNTDGEILHTYSTYARGLESFLGIYRMLDIVPKGRNEEGLPHGMSWVRHHDSYGASDDPFVQLTT